MMGGEEETLTLSRNNRLEEAPSLSLAVKRTRAVPVWLVAGVKVSVRLAPAPAITRLPGGNSVGFEEAASTVAKATSLSRSESSTANGPLELFAARLRSAMGPTTGGSFTG